MVMTMPTVAARLVMVFIVCDVWMCRYICEEPPLWGESLKRRLLVYKRGEALKIGSSNDT